jgi:dienelactone hydrolase
VAAKRQAVDIEAVREKCARVHGQDRADRMVAAGLMACAVSVYQAAGERRHAAEERVHAAVRALEEAKEKEQEWQCIAHGCVETYARLLDRR